MTEDKDKELFKNLKKALEGFKIPELTEKEKIELEKIRLAEREAKLTNFIIGGKP